MTIARSVPFVENGNFHLIYSGRRPGAPHLSALDRPPSTVPLRLCASRRRGETVGPSSSISNFGHERREAAPQMKISTTGNTTPSARAMSEPVRAVRFFNPM